MTSKAKKLHIILFLLLKIIVWPVLNVVACSKLILLHFFFFFFLRISPENWDFLRLGYGLGAVSEDQG